MSAVHSVSKDKISPTRGRTNLYASGEAYTIVRDISSTQRDVLQPLHLDSHSDGRATNNTALEDTSHTAPQWLQARADQWIRHESLKNDYHVHKRECARAVDPVAQKAVAGMDISCFVQPTTTLSPVPAENRASGLPSLFHAGSPPEDLNYSLRNFVAADPVEDPNVLYARIAVRQGRTMAGFVPALPQLRRAEEASEVTEDGEEAFWRQ